MTGCAGDADPHPFGTLDMAKDHGEELGEAVKFALDHPNWLTTLTGPIRAAFTETTDPLRRPDRSRLVREALERPQQGRRRHAQRMIETIDQGTPIRHRVSLLFRACLRTGRAS